MKMANIKHQLIISISAERKSNNTTMAAYATRHGSGEKRIMAAKIMKWRK